MVQLQQLARVNKNKTPKSQYVSSINPAYINYDAFRSRLLATHIHISYKQKMAHSCLQQYCCNNVGKSQYETFFFFLANSCQSVAVLMTWRQMSLSLAFLQAVWTPKFWGWTSSSTVLTQVVLGRPAGLLQSACGRNAAATMRWWSSTGAVRARWPNNLRWWNLTTSETGVQAVMSQTVSFVVCRVYGICRIFHRHQVSNASRCFLLVLVMVNVSHP